MKYQYKRRYHMDSNASAISEGFIRAQIPRNPINEKIGICQTRNGMAFRTPDVQIVLSETPCKRARS